MNADEQIRAIRKSKGMTQQEFAGFMEVSSSSIANIENGTREISKAMMKSIVEKCGVNAHWLLTGEGEMFTKTESEKTPCVKDVMVPVLSQKASCGPGVEWNSEQNLTDGIYVFSLDGDAYCKRLEFDRLANRIKIYSVRVADLEKAELLRTLDSTDEGFAERFQLFGKVFSWVHLAKE